MATYRAYKNKDGSLSYTATVRKTLNGNVIFSKSKTSTKKKDVTDWAKAREVELKRPEGIE